MRIAPFLLLSLSLIARVSTQIVEDPVIVIDQVDPNAPIAELPNEPIVPSLPTVLPYEPTMIPEQPVIPLPNEPIVPSHPTVVPPMKPTWRPGHHGGHGGRDGQPEHHGGNGGHGKPNQAQPVAGQTQAQPAVGHHCKKYLAHAACRQCVTAKGSLGFTPIADLHWCPTPGSDHFDHLGECKPINIACTSSLSTPIANITQCPNDVAVSKPSCGSCTADAYVWCQADEYDHDEYMGICRDASHLFPSRTAAEKALREREMRSDDDMTIDAIDRLCGPTHTAIIKRKECPRKGRFAGARLMMAILFHLIPILLCFSACCLCVRAIRRRRAARRTALLDVPTSSTVPSAPSSSDYPGVVSTSYAPNATLPIPLPNGGYVAPVATAPAATVPMQTFYPTLSTAPTTPHQGLRAPLLEQNSINNDGLIYGHVYPQGYQRVHQEI